MTDRLLRSPARIVAAPMAGGPTTVELAVAVARAGGFPFVAGGYLTADDLSVVVERVRSEAHHFGVNLFVPDRSATVDPAAISTYAAALEVEAARYGLTLSPEPVIDDDQWDAKLSMLIERPVPVVSLTFALPERRDIAALQAAGTSVLASVTTPDEALLARAAGVDGLVVQGPRAGGHSATFDPARRITDVDTAKLVRQIRRAAELPLIAAGGVDGPGAVARLLAAGAEAVAVGTLLLLADEAGTSPTHRAALTDQGLDQTVLTRAFTGRPARALRTGFIDRHDHEAPIGYPAVHHLTRTLRQAAGRAGDVDALHLWAGTGWRNSPTGPVADIVAWLTPSDPVQP